jgi:hypothetical protein
VRRLVEALARVRLGDEDVAVRRGDDIVRFGQVVRRIAGHAWRTEPHQHLALGAELVDRVPFPLRVGKFLELRGGGGARVGHPDVAFAVNVHAVWKDEHVRPEAGDDVALRIHLHDGINLGTRTGVCAATLGDPYVPAIAIHLQRAQ